RLCTQDRLGGDRIATIPEHHPSSSTARCRWPPVGSRTKRTGRSWHNRRQRGASTRIPAPGRDGPTATACCEARSGRAESQWLLLLATRGEPTSTQLGVAF